MQKLAEIFSMQQCLWKTLLRPPAVVSVICVCIYIRYIHFCVGVSIPACSTIYLFQVLPQPLVHHSCGRWAWWAVNEPVHLQRQHTSVCAVWQPPCWILCWATRYKCDLCEPAVYCQPACKILVVFTEMCLDVCFHRSFVSQLCAV